MSTQKTVSLSTIDIGGDSHILLCSQITAWVLYVQFQVPHFRKVKDEFEWVQRVSRVAKLETKPYKANWKEMDVYLGEDWDGGKGMISVFKYSKSYQKKRKILLVRALQR